MGYRFLPRNFRASSSDEKPEVYLVALRNGFRDEHRRLARTSLSRREEATVSHGSRLASRGNLRRNLHAKTQETPRSRIAEELEEPP